MPDLIDVFKGAVTVALIAYVTLWVITAKGSDSPKINDGVTVYGIRWPVRAMAYMAAALFFVIAVAEMRANSGGHHWPVFLLFVTLALGAGWFGTGVITSDETAISKKFLLRRSSLRWVEISEIRLHKRDGGAIELRGKGKSLIVDSRFVAPLHLQREIERRTKLQPFMD